MLRRLIFMVGVVCSLAVFALAGEVLARQPQRGASRRGRDAQHGVKEDLGRGEERGIIIDDGLVSEEGVEVIGSLGTEGRDIIGPLGTDAKDQIEPGTDF